MGFQDCVVWVCRTRRGRRGRRWLLYHTGLGPKLCSADARQRLGPRPAAPPWVWLKPWRVLASVPEWLRGWVKPTRPKGFICGRTARYLTPFRYSLPRTLKPAGRTCSRFNPLPSRLEREGTVAPGRGTASRKKLVPPGLEAALGSRLCACVCVGGGGGGLQ